MMKWLAPILVLLSFTDPRGVIVWVESMAINSLTESIDCVSPAKTKISLGNGTFVCVREALQQAVDKVDGARK